MRCDDDRCALSTQKTISAKQTGRNMLSRVGIHATKNIVKDNDLLPRVDSSSKSLEGDKDGMLT